MQVLHVIGTNANLEKNTEMSVCVIFFLKTVQK